MDPDNKALCKLMSEEGHTYQEIADTVVKKDGSHPKPQSVWETINFWSETPQQRGRPVGTRKTTAAEDATIVKKMLSIRGPNEGGAVDAQEVFDHLPPSLRAKVNPQLVRLRLNEAGYYETEKLEKDPATKEQKKAHINIKHVRNHILFSHSW